MHKRQNDHPIQKALEDFYSGGNTIDPTYAVNESIIYHTCKNWLLTECIDRKAVILG